MTCTIIGHAHRICFTCDTVCQLLLWRHLLSSPGGLRVTSSTRMTRRCTRLGLPASSLSNGSSSPYRPASVHSASTSNALLGTCAHMPHVQNACKCQSVRCPSISFVHVCNANASTLACMDAQCQGMQCPCIFWACLLNISCTAAIPSLAPARTCTAETDFAGPLWQVT